MDSEKLVFTSHMPRVTHPMIQGTVPQEGLGLSPSIKAPLFRGMLMGFKAFFEKMSQC